MVNRYLVDFDKMEKELDSLDQNNPEVKVLRKLANELNYRQIKYNQVMEHIAGMQNPPSGFFVSGEQNIEIEVKINEVNKEVLKCREEYEELLTKIIADAKKHFGLDLKKCCTVSEIDYGKEFRKA